MDAFNLVARLTLDSSEYDAALSQVQKELPAVGNEMEQTTDKANKFGNVLSGSFKAAAAAIGAVVTSVSAVSAAVIKSVGDVASYGDNIDKMSQKMGISAEAYQEWDAVMQHSGTSMETLKASMRTLASAAQSNSDAFKQLGISQKELQSLSQEELFSRTITALQNVEDTTKRTYLAGKTLGRGATELGALLNTSAEDTQKMKDRVHELGGVMSDEAVKAAAAYQDSLQDMSTAFEGLKRNMVSEFLPSVRTTIDGLTELFAGNQNSGLGLINNGISEFAKHLTDELPTALNTVTSIIGSIGDAITQNAPKIIQAGTNVILDLASGIIDRLPSIAEQGTEIIITLANGITDALPELIPATVNAVDEIVTTLTNPDTLSQIMNAGMDMLTTLAKGIGDAVPQLAETAVDVVLNLADYLLDPDNIVKIVSSAHEIVTNLKSGVIAAIPKLIEGAVELVGKFVEAIFETDWIDVGLQIASNIATGVIEGAEKVTNAGYQMGVDLYNALNEGANTFDSAHYKEQIMGGYFKYLDEATGEAEQSLLDFANKYQDVVTDTGEGFTFNLTGQEDTEYYIQLLDDLAKAYEDTGKSATDFAMAYASVREARNNLTVAAKQDLEITIEENLKSKSYQGEGYVDIYSKYIKPQLEKSAEQGKNDIDSMFEELGGDVAEKWDGAFETLAIGDYRNLGVIDRLGKVLSEEEEKANTIAQKVFSASQEWITRQTNAADITIEEQISMWEKVQAQFVNGSKQYLDAEDKIATLRKKQAENEKTTEEERTKEQKKQLEERKKAFENYEKQLASIQKEIDEINKNYSDKLESETRRVYDSFSLFEKVPERLQISGKDLLQNLEEQNQAIQKFYSDIDKLASRGVSETLVEEIRNMGVGAIDELDALLDLDNDTLKKYSEEYEKKNKLAADYATEAMKPLQEETNAKVAEKMSDIEALNKENAELIGSSFMENIALGMQKATEKLKETALGAFGEMTALAGDIFGTDIKNNQSITAKSKTNVVTLNINGVQYQNFSDLAKAISEELQLMTERSEAAYGGA